MKFLNELAMSLVLVALALGAIVGTVYAFAPDPGQDGAGPGALAGGFAIAFAILLHGVMMCEKREKNTKKDSGK